VTAERGEALRAQVREVVGEYRLPAVANSRPTRATPVEGYDHWYRTNTRPEREAGHRTAIIQLPLGDITSGEMRAVAQMTRDFGNGTLRTTNDQNIVLPRIPEAALPALHAALAKIDLANPDAGTVNDVVSCPGMDYCSLAITRSMGMAERIRAHMLDDEETDEHGFAARLGQFGIKISGCPNSCGQHHIGDIGLTGHSVTEADGVQRPYYSLLAGGSVGEGKGRVGVRLGRYPEEDAPAAVAALAKLYAKERQPGETFPAFVDRKGARELTTFCGAVAKEAAQSAEATKGASAA
jgi:sulfite reductase beta subunit-like hemoprotein